MICKINLFSGFGNYSQTEGLIPHIENTVRFMRKIRIDLTTAGGFSDCLKMIYNLQNLDLIYVSMKLVW